jgi:hypothetical protein
MLTNINLFTCKGTKEFSKECLPSYINGEEVLILICRLRPAERESYSSFTHSSGVFNLKMTQQLNKDRNNYSVQGLELHQSDCPEVTLDGARRGQIQFTQACGEADLQKLF